MRSALFCAAVCGYAALASAASFSAARNQRAGSTGSGSGSAASCPKESKYRTVVHEFVDGQAEAFWANMGVQANFQAFLAQNAEDNVHLHYFLPDTSGKKVNCLWETSSCWSDTEFQTWVDGPRGPGQGVFVNTPYLANVGAYLPATGFNDDGTPSGVPIPAGAAPQGSVYWVEHHFLNETVAAPWLANLPNWNQADYNTANYAIGVANPQFILKHPDSPSAMCVWETKEVMTPAQFQAFIDGPTGPGEGVFNNVIHETAPGGVMPATAFPASSDLAKATQDAKAVLAAAQEELAACSTLCDRAAAQAKVDAAQSDVDAAEAAEAAAAPTPAPTPPGSTAPASAVTVSVAVLSVAVAASMATVL